MAYKEPPSQIAYRAHKSRAKKRNIEFKLTYQQWYDWWLSNGVDKNQKPSAFSKNTLAMCRHNDTGAYELGNIYCATISQNSKDQNYSFKRKKIQTPMGVFPSARAAAIAHGYHPCSVTRLITTKPTKWFYL